MWRIRSFHCNLTEGEKEKERERSQDLGGRRGGGGAILGIWNFCESRGKEIKNRIIKTVTAETAIRFMNKLWEGGE